MLTLHAYTRLSGWPFALVLILMCSFADDARAFSDPLKTPAPEVEQVTSAHLTSIAEVNGVLIAVGARGLIALSDDGGKSWSQVASPVSSDLLDLDFPDDKHGWIVGHDGVVLRTTDGGYSWQKQYDGWQAYEMFKRHFTELQGMGYEMAAAYLNVVELNYKDGPEQALMDVWFRNPKEGFAVGTFGTLMATSDGGKTWTSWMERIDNPEVLHYNAIAGDKDGVFLASERGKIFRLNAAGNEFDALATGYSGTFFTVSVHGDDVIAAGLRGTVYRSVDGGDSWLQVDSGISSPFTDSRVLGDKRFLLASIDGRVFTLDAETGKLEKQPVASRGRYSSIAGTPGENLVTVGFSGIRAVQLKQP